MAEDSIKRSPRPVWRLAIAVFAGLALTVIGLAWPSLVRGNSPPVITEVEVTSSKETYFFSPPLDDSGGTVFFNNLGGEGADQIITVTVTAPVSNVIRFAGGNVFGIAPTTSISNTDGTWSVTYTIGATDESQNGVVFTVTDSNDLTDTMVISFTQDITDPEIDFIDVTDPQWDSNQDETDSTGNWYRTTLLGAGWSFTASITENGAGYEDGIAHWDHINNDDYDQTIPTGDGRGTFTQVVTNSDSLVAASIRITDRVGNVGIGAMSLGLDTTPPNLSGMSFYYLDDTDSGSDGVDPNTDYYDDPTIDLEWSVPPDGLGSGAGLYTLTTSNAPITSTTYAYDQPSGTLTGTLHVVVDKANSIRISVADHVGNVSPFNPSTSVFEVDTSLPANGKISVIEDISPQYLYIDPWERIVVGTLYYNDEGDASFTVIADPDGEVVWGNSDPWYVYFDDSWGESATFDYAWPYLHTYYIDAPETDDGFAVKFANNAGNVQVITITAVLDDKAPQVTFTDVTNPDYDPDGDELDGGEADDNWYRTSLLDAGWSFTTAITEPESGMRESRAYWGHSVVTNSQSIPAPGGEGTFLNVDDDSDGTVQVTVVVTDHVSNAGSTTLGVQLDGAPPSITPNPWSEDSPFLTRQGEVLYFSVTMPSTQTATVSGAAVDGTGSTGSGLDYVKFGQPENLSSVPLTQTTTGFWSSDYGFVSETGVGPGSVDVVVYDRVGNPMTHTYEYVGVIDQPEVAFDNVTPPGYDEPLNDPLDDIGNWYAEDDLNAPPPPGKNWWFHAAITPADTIGIAETSATLQHQSGPQDTIDPTLGSNSVYGTFKDFQNYPSGLFTITLTITDDLHRVATDTHQIRVDKEGPAVTGDGWTENSSYLHADGSTLYFSDLMTTSQVVTLSGQADDGPNGAGAFGQALFSAPESLGSSNPNPSLPNWYIEYFVSSSNHDGNSPVQVTLEDNLGNQTIRPYPYVLDITPPTLPGNFGIDTTPIQPGYYNTQSLALSWNASSDSQSQLQGYYLGTGSPPPSFYPPATTTTTFDTGADGPFTFSLTARDNVGNSSLASTDPITVDTQAPVPQIQAISESNQDHILIEWGAYDPTPGTWPVAYDVQYSVSTTGTWQSWFTNTPITSANFGPDTPIEIEAETPYYFRVRARDYVNNLSDWSAPARGGVGLKQIYLPILLKNLDVSIPFVVFDGFETGAFTGWKTGGNLSRSIVTHPVLPTGGTPPPLSGDDENNYAANLGSPGYGNGCSTPNVPVAQANIKAYAYVPVGGTPYLRFDYRVRSYDTVRSDSGEWWDRLEVQVNNTPLARYGNPNNEDLDKCILYDTEWEVGEIDLSDYGGQTIILTFFNENHEDGYYNTYSYIDNIRIEVN